MNFQAHLDNGQQLTIGHADGHTQIALSSDENGHHQAQTTAVSSDDWTQDPQLFSVGVGFVVQLETAQGQKWVSIDQNGIHSLDKEPNLNEAKPLKLKKTDAEAPEMKPMAPMKPMKPMAPMKPMN